MRRRWWCYVFPSVHEEPLPRSAMPPIPLALLATAGTPSEAAACDMAAGLPPGGTVGATAEPEEKT